MTRVRRKQTVPFEEPQVNLTPLIDVVFVILIGFILIAPLLDLDQVDLADASNSPSTRTINLQKTSPVVLYVHQNNTISLGKELVSSANLPILLKELHAHYPDAIPQLFHDKKGYFGTYQSVKNALEEAGYHQVDVILKPH